MKNWAFGAYFMPESAILPATKAELQMDQKLSNLEGSARWRAWVPYLLPSVSSPHVSSCPRTCLKNFSRQMLFESCMGQAIWIEIGDCECALGQALDSLFLVCNSYYKNSKTLLIITAVTGIISFPFIHHKFLLQKLFEIYNSYWCNVQVANSYHKSCKIRPKIMTITGVMYWLWILTVSVGISTHRQR